MQQLKDIAARYPTPFHLYDEQGIRANARRLKAAFSWNPGYREYFAVKATPTPAILKILQEEGCGCDCSSLTELMMAERIGCTGEHIMFSSNETPAEDYRLAAKLGASINLDDITHVDFLEKTIGYIPKKIGCRFNPGGTFSLGESREGFQVMDNPGDAKYGMTRAQITEAFRLLKAKGAEEFGIHAFLASNTLSNEYYPALARILFQLAVELQQETGCHITYINLSGGVGIPYRPEEPGKRHRRHRRGRAQGVRGDPRPGRHGRCGTVHGAWPLHARAVWPSRDARDPRQAYLQGVYRHGRLCLRPDAPGHVRVLPPHHGHGQGGRALRPYV